METRNNQQRGLAWISGILVALGILGFVPGIASNYKLVGLFQMGAWYNAIYIVAGLIGFVMLASRTSSAAYLRILAIGLALWAIIGLFVGTSGQVLGFINNNYWDVALNAVLAAVSASYGWAISMATTQRQDAMSFGEYQERDNHRNPRN